jgi:uncharacterized protein (DUF697 family)
LSREAWLGLYERMTRLVEKLPGGLQKPILRELVPIREIFLETRPARILLAGPPGKSLPQLLASLAGGQTIEPGENDNGWRAYRIPERGGVIVMDARDDVSDACVATALARFTPDVILVAAEPESSCRLEEAARRTQSLDPAIAVAAAAFGGGPVLAKIRAAIAFERSLAIRKPEIFAGEDAEAFAEGICKLLPNAAKLEFARLTGARKAQAQIASSLLKSFTAVCGVIAVQPIPLADMPILTSLQTLMVALIIHTSGRRAGPRLVIEFLGALGFNIGAGILFREGARALLKVVPVWGHAISGVVAGAGTYAIGRAAIAYFIEDIPIVETRKLFRRLLPAKKPPPALPPGNSG